MSPKLGNLCDIIIIDETALSSLIPCKNKKKEIEQLFDLHQGLKALVVR
jgi:hypothetical protein